MPIDAEPTMSNAPSALSISVVIPTHERAALLERSLESLTEQTLPASRFEVVIVDDGSTDATQEVCDRLGAELDLHYLRIENSGISAAKNLGLFAARAPLVLFFDDDDLADPELLEAHLAAHHNHPDERVAVLGYTAWAPELQLTTLMTFVTEVGRQLFSYPGLEDGEKLDYTYFWGGRSSCKRSFLVKHGIFDQDLPAMEDIELGFRLAREGLEVVYASAAKSYMARAITFDEFTRRCVKRGRAMWLYDARHDDPDVSRYCGVEEALELWDSISGDELASRIARIRELERIEADRGGLDDDDVKALHGLYRWTFAAFQASGMAQEAAAAREAAPVSGGGLRRAPGPTLRTAPLIIYGAPRSGTTYLNAILNAHPRVEITNETRIFIWVHRALRSLRDPQVALTLRDEFGDHLRRELSALVRDFYAERWPDALVWGDKNPHYAASEHAGTLEMIAEIYPGAKFIHVFRDGRDVVASLIRKRHPDGKPWVTFEDAHHAWNSHIAIGSRFAASMPAEAVLEVRYEDLVADDLSTAEQMCDFLNIDCDRAIVEFCEAQQRERTPVSGPTRDLGRGAEGSDWEEALPDDRTKDASLKLLRKNLLRFGYPI